ncbi:MAG: hypothetical protein KDB82_13220 [Planctomycetes bacterium]|nr:hypothetical protein [Planctomycetota bacterium]
MPDARKVGPMFVYDDVEVARQRAAWKLNRWLDGENYDDPVGQNRRFLWLAVLAGAVLIFDIAMVSHFVGPSPFALLLTAAGPTYVFVRLLVAFAQSSVDTPLNCVRDFVRNANRGANTRAWKLLTPQDRDNYTRAAPSVVEQDPVSVKRFAFDSRASFAAYWRAARALGPATRLWLEATKTVQFIRPTLAVVNVNIHTQRTMRLQRQTLAYVVRKVVVRYGDEWRIFDGEVLSGAEMHVNWVNEVLQARKAGE